MQKKIFIIYHLFCILFFVQFYFYYFKPFNFVHILLFFSFLKISPDTPYAKIYSMNVKYYFQFINAA